MKIGEKIRELRKARGLTQAALAREYITRNMLCEIEKGKATPSLDTLCYIAKELSVPAAYLLDGEEALEGYQRRTAMKDARAEYRKKNYAECYHRLCALPGTPDDEAALLLASCALEIGKSAFHSGNMNTARSYLERAIAHAEGTVYPKDSILSSALIYHAISSNVSSPKRVFDAKSYHFFSAAAAERELYAYMTDDPEYPYANEFYAAHEKAKRLIEERRYHDAIPLLLALEERKGEEGVSAYFLFRLYADMEIAYREDHDFERAYKYSAKQMALLSAFQA